MLHCGRQRVIKLNLKKPKGKYYLVQTRANEINKLFIVSLIGHFLVYLYAIFDFLSSVFVICFPVIIYLTCQPFLGKIRI